MGRTAISITSIYTRVARRLSSDGIGWFAREAWRRLYRRAVVGDVPDFFHVEISNCCNLRCEYCVLDSGAVGDKVMSEVTFANVLPALSGARSVALSGIAEPLMNRRLPEFLAQVRACAPDAVVTINTNASLLTAEMSEQLIDKGLDELVFSLDGTDPSLVDSVRRGGSLQRLLENIAKLQKLKSDRASDTPRLGATVVLQRNNVRALPAVVRLAARMGATAVNINGLEPYAENLVDAPVWTDVSAINDLAEVIQSAETASRETGVTLRFPSFGPVAAKCSEVLSPFILADGSVVPCSVLAYPRESLLGITPQGEIVRRAAMNERVTFGNVNDQSLRSIWGDAAYREFRRSVGSGHFPEVCGNCLMKSGVICPNPPLSGSDVLSWLYSRKPQSDLIGRS